jgi:hypothetical protein
MIGKSTIREPFLFSWSNLFSFFFHGTKKAPAFCLITTLVWALFVPGIVAQSSTNIPVFQFAIFYNMDLEIAAAQSLNITGPVFSNGGLWSGSTTITFANTVIGWGPNGFGQTNVPLGLANVVSMNSGAYDSLVLQANGTMVAWGHNWDGEASVPASLKNVVAIAGGDYHSLALENDGSPVILRQPTSKLTINSATALFNSAAVGGSQLTYQWQKDGTNLTDGGNLSGTTTAALTLTNVQTNDAGIYTMIVTNTFGSIFSSNATLTVLVLPSIAIQPAGCTNVAGTTVNFNVTADGTAPLNYQWQCNGTNLDGATNTMLTLTNVTSAHAGSYSVTVANQAGSMTSSNAILSVYATAAAALNGFSFSADNGFQFQIAGVPGFNYGVQASTNLLDWVPLITNASPFDFVDMDVTNFPQRFYRAVYLP